MTASATATEREAKVKAAHDKIDAAVEGIKSSDEWKQWLSLASKFYKYSFNNVMLIWAQRPTATYCASYNAWNQKFKRQVMKGEKGLMIFAPVLVKYTAAEIAQVPARAGQSHLVGFKVVYTFDVSQTEGQPLPEHPKVTLLEGEAPEGLFDELKRQASERGFTVTREVPEIATANGVTDFVARTIKIAPDLSDAQACKTMAHELAHAMLHGPQEDQPARQCRADAEVEAESVAFIVMDAFGVDAGAYSFGYVAGWSGKDPDAVKRSGQAVTRTSKKILEEVERQGEE